MDGLQPGQLSFIFYILWPGRPFIDDRENKRNQFLEFLSLCWDPALAFMFYGIHQ